MDNISNHMPSKVLLIHFYTSTVAQLDIGNGLVIHPTLNNWCNCLSMLGFKLTRAIKRDQCCMKYEVKLERAPAEPHYINLKLIDAGALWTKVIPLWWKTCPFYFQGLRSKLYMQAHLDFDVIASLYLPSNAGSIFIRDPHWPITVPADNLASTGASHQQIQWWLLR